MRSRRTSIRYRLHRVRSDCRCPPGRPRAAPIRRGTAHRHAPAGKNGLGQPHRFRTHGRQSDRRRRDQPLGRAATARFPSHGENASPQCLRQARHHLSGSTDATHAPLGLARPSNIKATRSTPTRPYGYAPNRLNPTPSPNTSHTRASFSPSPMPGHQPFHRKFGDRDALTDVPTCSTIRTAAPVCAATRRIAQTGLRVWSLNGSLRALG